MSTQSKQEKESPTLPVAEGGGVCEESSTTAEQKLTSQDRVRAINKEFEAMMFNEGIWLIGIPWGKLSTAIGSGGTEAEAWDNAARFLPTPQTQATPSQLAAPGSERERFEAFALAHRFNIERMEFRRDEYRWVSTQDAWTVWQAALASRAPYSPDASAEVVELLRLAKEANTPNSWESGTDYADGARYPFVRNRDDKSDYVCWQGGQRDMNYIAFANPERIIRLLSPREQQSEATEEKFYVATTHHEALWPRGVILWWGANQSGYSTFLEKAGKYTRAEAESICERRNNHTTEFMFPCALIDAQAVQVVDIDKLAELRKVTCSSKPETVEKEGSL